MPCSKLSSAYIFIKPGVFFFQFCEPALVFILLNGHLFFPIIERGWADLMLTADLLYTLPDLLFRQDGKTLCF